MNTLNKILSSRKIQWMSSVTGDPARLKDLARRMDHFYQTADGRSGYQEMIDNENAKKDNPHEIGFVLADYIKQNINEGHEILEVGCGAGNIYKLLQHFLRRNQYHGIEVAPHIIENNKQVFPDAHWQTATAYKIPYPDEKFDICFSHYVLEHIIHVESALTEMLRVVRNGGKLVLVFPDFIEQNTVPSQFIGLSPMPTAKARLKKGKVLDAMVSLWDSRIRVPRRLKNLKQYGPFVLNVNPLCLIEPDYVYPDVDALYISSKSEIAQWAADHGYKPAFPYGTEGVFRAQAFVVIEK